MRSETNMATNMSFCPAGFESDEDFDDEDGFMFGYSHKKSDPTIPYIPNNEAVQVCSRDYVVSPCF